MAGLAGYFRLPVPEVWPADEGPDDWQSCAWTGRADRPAALGADPRDDHSD